VGGGRVAVVRGRCGGLGGSGAAAAEQSGAELWCRTPQAGPALAAPLASCSAGQRCTCAAAGLARDMCHS
jgi:hypothetical protein